MKGVAQSRHQIQLNYRKTLQQASALEELADKIDGLKRGTIDESMGSIASSWKGDTADKYNKKGNRLGELVKYHSGELRRTANTLRRTAENTYRAELWVLELAEKRWGR